MVSDENNKYYVKGIQFHSGRPTDESYTMIGYLLKYITSGCCFYETDVDLVAKNHWFIWVSE